MINYQSAEDAISLIKNNERVFVHGGAATPNLLIDTLALNTGNLSDIEFVHIHTEGETNYSNPGFRNSFHTNSFFIGANLRPFVNSSNVQYVPVFLSEIPSLFRKGVMPLDTALIQVSPPDQHGYCSLGVSVDIAKAATDVALKIIALVNPKMPRSHGDGQIHISKIAAAVFHEHDLYELKQSHLSETELAIGKNIAEIIEDGATLQMGIGGIPNAVLQCLNNHKDLGIHTEMFSDGILPLVEKGVINGRMNKNDKMTAINSAVEIDLSGQVCSDSIGNRIISGVGGQMDFIRGASLSEGGKPIIAISSVTSKGESKIVPFLKQGAGVVTTRAHVHFVATEFGIVDLYGKNLAQRAKALISIAHPDHREELSKKAYEFYGG